MKGYPRWFLPCLIGTFVASLFTGILLLPTMLSLRLEIDVEPILGGDQRLMAAAVHVGAGFLLCTALGALLPVHARSGWRRKVNVISGIALIALPGLQVLTGIGSFYLGDETMIRYNSISHAGLGGLMVLFFVYHSLTGCAKVRAKSSLHDKL